MLTWTTANFLGLQQFDSVGDGNKSLLQIQEARDVQAFLHFPRSKESRPAQFIITCEFQSVDPAG